MKVNKSNYKGLIINNLHLLLAAFENDEISKMVFDGDAEDRIKELEDLIKFYNKLKP